MVKILLTFWVFEEGKKSQTWWHAKMIYNDLIKNRCMYLRKNKKNEDCVDLCAWIISLSHISGMDSRKETDQFHFPTYTMDYILFLILHSYITSSRHRKFNFHLSHNVYYICIYIPYTKCTNFYRTKGSFFFSSFKLQVCWCFSALRNVWLSQLWNHGI